MRAVVLGFLLLSSPCPAQTEDTPLLTYAHVPTGWTLPMALNTHAVSSDDHPDGAPDHGRTLVRYLIQADGALGNVQIVTGSGSAELDAAALVIVRRWQWKPATHDGQPAAARMQAWVVW